MLELETKYMLPTFILGHKINYLLLLKNNVL